MAVIAVGMGEVGDEQGAGIARRTEQVHEARAKRADGRMMEGEVAHVQAKGAVGRYLDKFLDTVVVFGLAIGGHAHHLVLSFVDLETEPGGEGGVEQAQGVRKTNLLIEPDVILAGAVPAGRGAAEGCAGPLTHAVYGQNGGFLERRTEEGAGGM